ncbi:hypothetical protein HPP92_018500 [Vanilla planifolia]|uniref:Inhibitor I9 domain-containing protein n=1 Tax=Vanilla planifolia TaxID=51239 RepID=A0A835QHP4_VANPL|nr:hypothetical protein HPP92_018500 [Vanilla planifolia]
MGKSMTLDPLSSSSSFCSPAPPSQQTPTTDQPTSSMCYHPFVHPPLHRRSTGTHLPCASSPYLRLPRAQILYAYDRVADGFAARLTDSQASFLRRLPHVVSVLHDRPRFLHTTYSPSFLRLSPSSGIWPLSDYASSVVVAVLDTGIFPYSDSFVDHDLPSPPSFYRSSCAFLNVSSDSGPCNNKLVGAKFFYKGYEAALGHPIDETIESKSPLDTEGHGAQQIL